MKAPDQRDHEPDRVLHEIDGIQEYDNRLPNWWLYTLYGALIFAAGYWYHYHSGGFGEHPAAEYKAEVERELAAQANQIQVGEATPEALVALVKDANAVALGGQVFASTCAPCHRGDGGGVVGPNLTDEYWLHGGAPDKIYKTVAAGVPDKGMPAWQAQLGALKTQAVTAFVMSLKGKNVADGKAPQGDRESLSLQ